MGGGDPAMIEELRRFYGLDVSVAVQLGRYLWRLLQLDLGFSAIYGKPVSAVILERLPATLLLMGSALSFAFAGGMALGRPRGAQGQSLARHADLDPRADLLRHAVILVRADGHRRLRGQARLAAGGRLRGDRRGPHRLPPRCIDIAWHLLLPTLTLALIFLATYLRIMRASMLEVMNLDFVRTARAKGLSPGRVVRRHVLRNALLPMVTLIGLQAGTMLGGSVVVESVFALPGLGRLAYEAVVQRDLNTLLGIVFVSALLVIAVNFIVDLLYARLDPRIVA